MTKPNQSSKLIVYGHAYCWQAAMMVRALRAYQVDHEWRDIIEGDPSHRGELRKLARGYLSVPTVIFPDGAVIVEPCVDQVLDKVGYPLEKRLKGKFIK